MHDLLYERQESWMRRRRPASDLRDYAVELGVDGEAFETCYDGDAAEEVIERHDQAARRLGVRATPTFYVNGRPVIGAPRLEEWRALLAETR